MPDEMDSTGQVLGSALRATVKFGRRVRLAIRNRLLHLVLRSSIRPAPMPGLEKIGSDYGGWVIPVGLLTPNSICYSAGLGEDATFDEEMVKRFGCRVYSFDPTPRAIHYGRLVASRTPGITFLEYGLWSNDAVMRFFAPADRTHVSHSITNLQKTNDYFEAECKSLRSVMRELGHHQIDLLKLDIEGAEYAVLSSVVELSVRVPVICVEFDQPDNPFRMFRMIRRLRRHGYDVVNIDGWNLTFADRIWREVNRERQSSTARLPRK